MNGEKYLLFQTYGENILVQYSGDLPPEEFEEKVNEVVDTLLTREAPDGSRVQNYHTRGGIEKIMNFFDGIDWRFVDEMSYVNLRYRRE